MATVWGTVNEDGADVGIKIESENLVLGAAFVVNDSPVSADENVASG